MALLNACLAVSIFLDGRQLSVTCRVWRLFSVVQEIGFTSWKSRKTDPCNLQVLSFVMSHWEEKFICLCCVVSIWGGVCRSESGALWGVVRVGACVCVCGGCVCTHVCVRVCVWSLLYKNVRDKTRCDEWASGNSSLQQKQ